MSLPQPSALESLDAFYREHRLCYQLDGGQEAASPRVWLACSACEVRLPPASAPRAEMRMLHRWLDSWAGVGLVAAGMQRQGWELQLTAYGDGH